MNKAGEKLTNYEDIKKTSQQTPNQYIVFGRVHELPIISILPDPINTELKRVINPKIPNKTYYVDDGKYTIRILSKFIGKDIGFEFALKYNDETAKKKKPIAQMNYDDYVQNYKFYLISGAIVILALLIFSLPILKSLV